MSKEDMMNKISFALKDPILQMGFEVICSKLSRLEKENAELKEQTSDNITAANYKHCAEIEKQRRMTNKELARWIRENPMREWKYKNGVTVYGYYGYEEKCENEEVISNILIREDGGEWREPLLEVEE